MFQKLLICCSWGLNNHYFISEKPDFLSFCLENKKKSHLHGDIADPKRINGFHFGIPNASMISTLGSQTCQW